jgi:hypothetical protein
MKTRQHVAAAALREMRIARRIHKNFSDAPANERLVSFQNDPAIAESARDFAQRRRGSPALFAPSCSANAPPRPDAA